MHLNSVRTTAFGPARPNKIVTAAEAVRLIHDGDTVATGGFVGIGFAEGIALALEERPELAVDRDDPLEPRVVARLWREVLEGQVEVVGQLHDPREQGLAGAVEVALPVGLRPALEVRVVGRGPLGRHKVLVGLRERRFAFGGQRLDLGEERRRSRVELRDPVVGSRPAVRRGLVRMVRHAASPSFRSRGGPRDRS